MRLLTVVRLMRISIFYFLISTMSIIILHYWGYYYRESPCHSNTKRPSLEFSRKRSQPAKYTRSDLSPRKAPESGIIFLTIKLLSTICQSAVITRLGRGHLKGKHFIYLVLGPKKEISGGDKGKFECSDYLVI